MFLVICTVWIVNSVIPCPNQKWSFLEIPSNLAKEGLRGWNQVWKRFIAASPTPNPSWRGRGVFFTE